MKVSTTETVLIRRVPKSLWSRVKARASLEDRTLGQVVTQALQLWLSSNNRSVSARTIRWADLTALGEDPAPDVSERHDYYLAKGRPDERTHSGRYQRPLRSLEPKR